MVGVLIFVSMMLKIHNMRGYIANQREQLNIGRKQFYPEGAERDGDDQQGTEQHGKEHGAEEPLKAPEAKKDD